MRRRVCVIVLMILGSLVLPLRVVGEPTDVRVITVRVGVDEPYRASSDWEARLRSTLQAVSARWVAVFNIRWDIGAIVPWASRRDLRFGPRGTPTDELVGAIPRGGEDVVLLVSGRPRLGQWCAEATPFGDVVAVHLPCRGRDAPPDERLLSHELAHLFGGFHVTTRSVMNSLASSDDFDAQTSRIVQLMRGFTFSAGIEAVEPATREAWTAIFDEGHAADDMNLIAKALRNRGGVLARAKKLDEAKALFEEALRIDPRFALAHVELGKVASEQKRFDDALDSFRRAIAIDPKYAAAHDALGNELMRRQRFADGVSALRTAAALEPSKATIRASLGYALLSQGKIGDAVRELDVAVRLDGAYAYARRQLGDALTRQGQAAAAETHLRQAVLLEPNEGKNHLLLGTALGMQGKLQEAVATLQTAIKLDPTSALAHGNLGYTYSLKNQWTDAVAEYNEALRLDPNHVPTRINLGMAHWRARRLDEAAAEFRTALRFAPTADGVRVNLGRVVFSQGKFDEAIGLFSDVLARNPRAGEVHLYIGQAHAAAGRYAAAWESVGRAETLGVQIPHAFAEQLARKMPRPAGPPR